MNNEMITSRKKGKLKGNDKGNRGGRRGESCKGEDA